MKFSIIIPAHNSAKFIMKAIRSVLIQTYQDFQIIVVDDGSSDNTVDVVLRHCQMDQRIVLLKHPFSRGPSAARNTAIEHASGEWIALLDSDDEFLPTRLETLLSLAEARGLDAVADGLELVDFATGNNRGLAFDPTWLSPTNPITLSYMISRDWPGRYQCWSFGTMKPIFRRKIIEANKLRYDEDIKLGEDLLFYASLIMIGARFGVTPDHLYRYSVRDDSISAKPRPSLQLVEVNKRITYRFRTLTDLLPDAISLPNILRDREFALWFQVFTWYLRLGMLKEALHATREMPLIFIMQQICNRILRRICPKI